MLKQAETIYEKYEAQRKRTGYVLPRYSNPKLNKILKEIAKAAGIKKVLTHHVARHTFATTITLGQGLEIKTVSKMLGHSSIKSTEVYAKVSTARLIDANKELNRKLEEGS
jgi:site-specific recombinase XerD